MTEAIDNAYALDVMEIAQERLRSGQLDRRTFLTAAAAMGFFSGLNGEAKSAASELVVVNFGGAAAREYRNAYGAGCQEATGMKMAVDGSGVSAAKIRAMVEAGQVVWDVCDYSPYIGLQLGGRYLEEIDYSIVDKQKILLNSAWRYSCAAYVFSFVIAYDAKTFPQPPRTWVDFFDLKRFPGKRTMFKSPLGQIEAALLAAGIERDKLYPLNLDLALGKIKEIKSEIIWWQTGAQAQQMFRDREVAMGNIWHSRATLLRNETNGAVDLTFNDGVLVLGGWSIPKNNPAGRVNANKFIAAAQNPEAQLKIYTTLFNGPANPETTALIPAELRRLNPSDPENVKLQAFVDQEYWGENLLKIQDRWLDAIS